MDACLDRRSPCVIDGGRSRQLDDAVREVVVAGAGRQDDDLEIRRDGPEQLQRAHGPRVVKRHERVVEDERRSAVTGDQPDQTEPRREVHDVERPLRQLADRDPAVALRRPELDPEGRVVDADALIATARDPPRSPTMCRSR